MSHTHDLAEWASVLSLGVGVTFSCFVPWLLLVDSVSARDFDPRPAVRRATESGLLDPLLVTAANARYDARELACGVVLDARLSLRHAVVTAAALLALLLPATEGATR